MCLLLKASIFCTYIFLVLKIEALKIETGGRQWEIKPNTKIFYNHRLPREDDCFLFALPRTHDNISLVLDCIDQNDEQHIQVCGIQLSEDSNEGAINHLESVSVERLGEKGAIFTWLQTLNDSSARIKLFKRISVVNFDPCSSTHLTFPVAVLPEMEGIVKNPLIFENTFEVVVTDKTLCGSNKTCMKTYDFYGHQIANHSLFYQPDKRFYLRYVTSQPAEIRELFANAVDEGLLTESELEDVKRSHLEYTGSGVYDLYGICERNSSMNGQLFCEQFARNTSFAMNATVPFTGDDSWFVMRNLPGGGILLVTGSCDGERCDDFNVTKIFLDGHVSEPVVIGLGLECNGTPGLISICEDDKSEMCFHFACTYDNVDMKETRIKYLTKCTSKLNLFSMLDN